MNFRKVCTILAGSTIIFGILLQTGCASKRVSTPKSNHKITIGFSMDTLKEERWYKDQDNFVKESKKLNANVIVDVAYESASEQINQVKDMISKGIDVLVIIPHDATSAATAVSLAKKSGVKVISYDRLVLNANVDLYISFDNEKVGELQASSMVKAAPQGNYVIIDGPSSDHNTIMITKGIMEILNPYVKKGKIKIVKQMEATDWMSDEAHDCMTKLLQNGVRINAVIAENDGLAGGVIDALSESQLVPEVPVVGMDADLSACQRVVEGQQLMTVYKPIDKLAVTAADIAVKMAKGDKISVDSKINDGKYNVPYYKIQPIAVYKSNMNSTVIKDGFHSMSEVYMNIPKSEWSVTQ